MAQAPTERYQAIGDMVIALEAYLEESGVAAEKVTGELAHYFAAPASYESELAVRIVDALTQAGQKHLSAQQRAAALDAFDRVLTIDPRNPGVRAILDRLHRRSRAKWVATAAIGAAVLSLCGYAIQQRAQPLPASTPAFDVAVAPPVSPQTKRIVYDDPPPAQPQATDTPTARAASPNEAPSPPVDAPLAATLVEVAVAVVGSEYRVDNETTWHSIEGKEFTISVADRAIVEIRNPYCPSVKVALERAVPHVDVAQPFSPASIVAKCSTTDVSVSIDGASFTLDSPKSIEFDKNALSKDREVAVVFTGSKAIDRQQVLVTAGQLVEVRCALH